MPKPDSPVALSTPTLSSWLPSSKMFSVSIWSRSSCCTPICKRPLLFSVGSRMACARPRTPSVPPTTCSGPPSCVSRCSRGAHTFCVVGSMGNRLGSKLALARTVTVCGRYQLALVKTNDAGTVMTWPSVLMAMVTSAPGACVRRTV